MLDIALTPEQRKDGDIIKAVAKVHAGATGAVDDLHTLLLQRIRDEETCQHLRNSRKFDPNAPGLLYTHLKMQMDALVQDQLHPLVGNPLTVAEANIRWVRLRTTIMQAAQRLWRDDFLLDASREAARKRLVKGQAGTSSDKVVAEQGHLELVARQSRMLMLLWVEASLYRLRTNSNFRNHGGAGDTQERAFGIRAQAAKIVKEYEKTLRGWDKELNRVTGQQYFLVQSGDAQPLRALSKLFGTEAVGPDEKGWVSVAGDAEAELRYRYFNALLAERVRAHRYVGVVGYFVRKITTGYGTKPLRFAGFAGFTIGVFALAFLASDFLNPGVLSTHHFCAESNLDGMTWYDVIVKYLYLAVTNLTSLGPNADVTHVCGGNITKVLLMLSSLAGYFLLATLAALFIEQRSEAERW